MPANGIKFFARGGIKLDDDLEDAIEVRMGETWQRPTGSGVGRVSDDPGLVDAAIADPTTHDEVRAEHDRLVAAGGYGVPPLIFADGRTLVGPVLLDPPKVAAAARLGLAAPPSLAVPPPSAWQPPPRPLPGRA